MIVNRIPLSHSVWRSFVLGSRGRLAKSVLLCLALGPISLCVAQSSGYVEDLIITPKTHPATGDQLHVCEYAGTERSISLSYAKLPPLPCELGYHREQEGEDYEVLWKANFDEGFCENKLATLLQELKAAGWICEQY